MIKKTRLLKLVRFSVFVFFLTTSLQSLAVDFTQSPRRASFPNSTWGIIGDAGLWPESRVTRDSLLADQVLNLIIPGDNIYDLKASYESIWAPWSSVGFDFDIVALGNHTKGYSEEVRFFKMPGEYYTKVQNGSRFLVLNSDNLGTVTQQAAWLDDQLSKAQEKFIFVVFHHPPYTISNRHRWEERRDFHLRIRPLLVKYAEKITSLVVGHDHLASMIMLNNTPMIVSGATWETQTPSYLDYKEGPVHIKTVWNYRGHVHWVRLDILPATHEVWVNFVNAQTRTVSCSIRIAPKPLLKRPNCQ